MSASRRPIRLALLTVLVLYLPTASACGDDDPAPTSPDSGVPEPDSGVPEPDSGVPEERLWWSFDMPDPFLDELVLYYLGLSAHRGAEVAEVLETASRVTDAQPETWVEAWTASADRLLAVAEQSDAAGHRLTAGYAYHRSSTYLRAALHYHPNPYAPEVRTLAEAAVDRYARFLERIYPDTATIVDVPYEGTTLKGYFFRGAAPGSRAPTIIAHSGRDAWAEDLLYIAEAGLERGYNTLLIDGPGQGKVIRIQGLPFRPDWENFITPVVDSLETMDSVDMNALILMGASMGGYLAPRAATVESRLRWVVANPGVVSWNDSMRSTMAGYLPGFEEQLAQGDEVFDGFVQSLFAYSDFLEWGFVDMAWHHGVTKPSELMHALTSYTFEGRERDIAAHVLVIDAEDEGTRGDARLLYDRLDPERRDLITFTREEAAQFHVQPGAIQVMTHRIFDWLDAELAP